ncbi:MAG: uracil-DNA glycosylase [Puniceicoccales bacterium]|jgi:DNA polymerase|nr:uracil-DNA glycosylase [Puniceicoccales bacterium]
MPQLRRILYFDMPLSVHKILELLEMELQDLKDSGVRALPISRKSITSLGKIFSNSTECLNVCAKDPQNSQSAEIMERENVPQGTLPPLGISEKISIPNLPKADKYEWLKNKVLNCEVCQKHIRAGKKIVFGVGSIDADIFFCGEAPGADEETEGEPFVGRAGQLLTKIISAMGLRRSDVYIANIMNWRPEMPTATGNRPPTREEMSFCLPYLLAQIEIVQPKVVVALGATAASGLLGHDPSRRMSDIHGRWTTFANIPLIVTFHPSYLLRNHTNSAKRTVWEDMLRVMEKVKMPISEKQRNYFMGRQDPSS